MINQKRINYFMCGVSPGIILGIAGSVFLVYFETNILREILFSIGLISIFHLRLNLFTGKAGFIFTNDISDMSGLAGFGKLFTVLAANFTGVFLWSLLIKFTPPSAMLMMNAAIITDARTEINLFGLFLSAVGCGIIVNLAARAKENMFITVLCVCAFLSLSLSHCIADLFFYIMSGFRVLYIKLLAVSVAGNFIGCNVLRFMVGSFEMKTGDDKK